MLSILPKHVADEMLKDMKKDESQKDQQQFNTMYMYRHENVRCARRGPGLPGQHGAGPRGVGVAPQARERPCGLGARPPTTQRAPRAGAALPRAAEAETRVGLCGPARVLHRRRPEWGRDLCGAAQPFGASSGAQRHAPPRKDASVLRQERGSAGEGSPQGELNVGAPNSPWRGRGRTAVGLEQAPTPAATPAAVGREQELAAVSGLWLES